MIIIIIPRRQKKAEVDDTYTKFRAPALLSGETDDMAGIYYRPKTRETKQTYEVLLSFIQAALGDQVNHNFAYGGTHYVLLNIGRKLRKIFLTSIVEQ